MCIVNVTGLPGSPGELSGVSSKKKILIGSAPGSPRQSLTKCT